MPVGKRFKIACIGAGNVGATVAQYCLDMQLGDVVLYDIVEGLPQGKALDLTQAGPVRGYSCVATGTNDYRDIAGSNICVVTAGLPRKPGMSRDDLVEKNGTIVAGICENILRYAPESVVIFVTNPLDVMAYLALKKLGYPPRKVVGMAGTLDSARLRSFVAGELGVSMKNVDTMVLGSHGDEMVPLPAYTTVSGVPVTQLMAEDKIEAIVERTRKGGGEIVALLKTGSAYYAPSAASVQMAEAIIRDKKRVLPCAAYCDKEYGIGGYFVGVPCILGKNGVEKVLELDISDADRASLHRSAGEVRTGIDGLRELGLL